MGRIKLAGRQNLYLFIDASVFIEPKEIPFGKAKPDNYIQFPMRRKDGSVIPGAEVMRMTAANLDGEFASVLTTSEQLAQIS